MWETLRQWELSRINWSLVRRHAVGVRLRSLANQKENVLKHGTKIQLYLS
jgi:hypothetical protein